MMRKIPVEVYSRVVGYFRPVQSWNKGKQAEFQERSEMPKEKIAKRLSEKCEYTDDIKTA